MPRVSSAALAVWLAAGPIGAVSAAAPPELAADLSSSQREQLERGQVVVLEAAVTHGTGRAAAAVLIHAPADKVWAVMVDCASAPEFVPRLRSCRVVEEGGGRRVLEHRVQVLRVLPALTYRFEEHLETGKRIDFHRTSGALREMQGSWSLENGGGGTLVRYAVALDPGFAVPGWLVRHLLRHDLAELLAALRDRVEHGGTEHAGARR